MRERFADLSGSVTVEGRALPWRFGSFAEMGQLFRDHGPRGLDEMPEDKAAEFVAEAQAVVDRHNRATDGSIDIAADYTLVVARKRG